MTNFVLKRHSVVTFLKLCLCLHTISTVIAQTSVILTPLPVEVSEKPLLAVAQIYGKLLVHHLSTPFVYCVKILEFIMIFYALFSFSLTWDCMGSHRFLTICQKKAVWHSDFFFLAQHHVGLKISKRYIP